MNSKTWSAVDDYIAERLIPADPALDAALANNSRHGLPAIDVSAAQGKLLNLMARMVGASRILEIGTLGGYSTIWLARALAPGGRLISLELDPRHAEVARANVKNAGLSDVVDIRVGPALKSLKAIDSRERRAVRPRLHRCRQVEQPPLSDMGDQAVAAGYGDHLRQRRSRRRGARRQRARPERRGCACSVRVHRRDARLDGTAIQTVGAKGYDGFAIAIVN